MRGSDRCPSALKHGLGTEETLHAYRRLVLEVGYLDGDPADVIGHAMKAREKFLR